MKLSIFKANMKLADLINADYRLLLLLPRFGLNLGFGDRSVRECCEKNRVQASLFVMICNIYAFGHYLPDSRDIEEIDADALIAYLQKSHTYYLHSRIEGIHDQLRSVAGSCEEQHSRILSRFLGEYRDEVIRHFSYEENVVFPYIQNLLRGEKSDGYEIGIFDRNHSNIDDKLNDLKNIIIKYLPCDSMQQEKTNMLFNIFSLEEDLSKHSLIEDKVLIPMVRKLEERYDNR